jgi:O-antigen ligase
MNDQEFKSTRASDSLVWSLLFLGAFVHVPISLPSVNTQVSAFDFILPALFAWAYFSGRIIPPSRRVIVTVACILTAFIGHSVSIYVFKDELQRVWLLKETLKNIVLVVEFFLLLILFQSRVVRFPQHGVIVGALAIAVLAVGILSFQMLEYETFFFARTVYCTALASLLFLLAADGAWTRSSRRCLLLLLAGTFVILVSLLSLNKGIAGLTFLMTAWVALVHITRRTSAARASIIIGSLVLAIFFTVIMVKTLGISIDLLQRMDSMDRSISVRAALWFLGLEAFWHHFPWGLGFGQYWEAVVTNVELAREGHRFVHNSFIALMAELGMLGLILSAGLLALIVQAVRGWPPMIRPPFLMLVLTPLLLHDAHSIRMLLIVTAVGLAQLGRGSCNIENPSPARR